MKLTILTILLFITTSSFGQDFKKDWTTFQDSKWSINSIADTSLYLDKPKQGILILVNKANPKLSLTYDVFLKSEVDSAFRKKINNWMFIQSCLGNFTRFDLTFNQYFYLLRPCQSCSEKFKNDCEQLSKKLGLIASK